MQVIHKQNMVVTDRQTLDLPQGAVILSVQEQYGILTMWYTNPDTGIYNTTTRIFLLRGTGVSYETHSTMAEVYLGTVQTLEGVLVWHIFEEVVV